MNSKFVARGADKYDSFMGRWSRRLAPLFLDFAGLAYVLVASLRRIGLAGTEFAKATCGTIRLKLLKIGALITISVRRVKIAFASACPSQVAFAIAHERLCRHPR